MSIIKGNCMHHYYLTHRPKIFHQNSDEKNSERVKTFLGAMARGLGERGAGHHSGSTSK